MKARPAAGALAGVALLASAAGGLPERLPGTLVFTSARDDDAFDTYAVRADGTGGVRRLLWGRAHILAEDLLMSTPRDPTAQTGMIFPNPRRG